MLLGRLLQGLGLAALVAGCGGGAVTSMPPPKGDYTYEGRGGTVRSTVPLSQPVLGMGVDAVVTGLTGQITGFEWRSPLDHPFEQFAYAELNPATSQLDLRFVTRLGDLFPVTLATNVLAKPIHWVEDGRAILCMQRASNGRNQIRRISFAQETFGQNTRVSASAENVVTFTVQKTELGEETLSYLASDPDLNIAESRVRRRVLPGGSDSIVGTAPLNTSQVEIIDLSVMQDGTPVIGFANFDAPPPKQMIYMRAPNNFAFQVVSPGLYPFFFGVENGKEKIFGMVETQRDDIQSEYEYSSRDLLPSNEFEKIMGDTSTKIGTYAGRRARILRPASIGTRTASHVRPENRLVLSPGISPSLGVAGSPFSPFRFLLTETRGESAGLIFNVVDLHSIVGGVLPESTYQALLYSTINDGSRAALIAASLGVRTVGGDPLKMESLASPQGLQVVVIMSTEAAGARLLDVHWTTGLVASLRKIQPEGTAQTAVVTFDGRSGHPLGIAFFAGTRSAPVVRFEGEDVLLEGVEEAYTLSDVVTRETGDVVRWSPRINR
ncbi:MAG: hypothetical protein ACK4XJ_03345 [Fimbriimonadaceae bacterium]